MTEQTEQTKKTKKVGTKLNCLLHAEFIRATRLKNETMNGVLRRLAAQYTEDVKSELLRTLAGEKSLKSLKKNLAKKC